MGRVALALGLYGSGSTWGYNILRAMLEQHVVAKWHLVSLYAEELTDAVDAQIGKAEAVVIKAHHPSSGMRLLARMSTAMVLITLRDPRDCVVSMMERFHQPFDVALDHVARSARSAMRWFESMPVTVLRYEDGFSLDPQHAGPAAIKRIGAALGLPADPDRDIVLAARFAPEKVAEMLTTIFEGTAADGAPQARYDEVTQWHIGHVGDGKIGKYVSRLSAEEIAQVETMCWSLMRRFGYTEQSTVGLAPGGKLRFIQGTPAADMLGQGFRPAEGWGAWTCAQRAQLAFALPQPVQALQLVLQFICGPLLRAESGQGVTVIVNDGKPQMLLAATDVPPDKRLMTRMLEVNLLEATDVIVLQFDFSSDTPPPPARGWQELGLGLIELQVTYGLT